MTTAALVALAEATVATTRLRLERRMAARVAVAFRRGARRVPVQRMAREALEQFGAPLQEDLAPPDALDVLVASMWPEVERQLFLAIEPGAVLAARAAGNVTLARIGYGGSMTMGTAVRDRIATGSLGAARRIDETSRRLLRPVLARGIAEGKSAAQIARDLRAEMARWSTPQPGALSRAEMIARTETAEAWESTAYEVLARNGWGAREWHTAQDERVDQDGVSGPCIDNEAAGPVPLDRPFPSGAWHPPEHPFCRCDTSPAPGFGPGQEPPEVWRGGDSGGFGDVVIPART